MSIDKADVDFIKFFIGGFYPQKTKRLCIERRTGFDTACLDGKIIMVRTTGFSATYIVVRELEQEDLAVHKTVTDMSFFSMRPLLPLKRESVEKLLRGEL